MLGDGDFPCVKELMVPAEMIIESGSGVSRRTYEERVKLWNEVRNNYSRFENRECGTFDRTLDPQIRSKFEGALLTLAVSFRRKKEDFAEANIFSDDELRLYEIIEMYQVLPSKKELRTILLSERGSEFLNVHYRYIDGLVLNACVRTDSANPYLPHFLKNTWNRYDNLLQEVVTGSIEHNGLRWFITFIGDGKKTAEQIVYNISGGTVNLGNGVQVVDSVLNRVGITNEKVKNSLYSNRTEDSPVGTLVQDSVINKSVIGDRNERQWPNDR